jgi:hypothetical protein
MLLQITPRPHRLLPHARERQIEEGVLREGGLSEGERERERERERKKERESLV